jgi:hypothetical protein
MPTTPARARKWIESDKAIKRWSDAGLFFVQLVNEPSGHQTQKVVIGIDPGKLYSGLAVQSSKDTLFMAHLVLPFKDVKKKMEQRAMMRRTRRGRRINRDVAFKLRNHRQKRFENRRAKKVPPSIRANRQLELRVVTELIKIFPVSSIVFEYVTAKGDKGFSPVMVGQNWAIAQLSKLAPVNTLFGWQTSQIRRELGLIKSKDKSIQSPESHAVDGIALASSEYISYSVVGSDSMQWTGAVEITPSVFKVIKRPPISRRQLHLFQFRKGAIRRKYGGTVTRHGYRKGDLVLTPKGLGYVSGDTGKQISVSDSNWKRLGQISASKVQLIRRNNGLLVA